jgi:hypothetical protein
VEPGLDTGMNQIDFICFERSNLCFFLVWFNQPKHMPDWLYQFFGDVVKPLLFAKDICKQLRHASPPLFTDSTQPHSPPMFWVQPPEPVISLLQHCFDPLLGSGSRMMDSRLRR